MADETTIPGVSGPPSPGPREEAPGGPDLHVEPPIPVTTEFCTVGHVRAVIDQLDAGRFRQAALLVERMLFNPRLRAVLGTRLAGLIAAKVRFEAVRNNRDARRAAREFAEDWPAMAPSPTRKKLMKWALMLGFDFAQRAWAESPTSGRQIFRLRPYWPGFADWYWSNGCYKVQTFNKGVVDVPTPSLGPMPPASASPWVVMELYAENSHREGIVHASWRPWLGHDWSMRDQARASEKHGVGIIKALYPRGQGDEHKKAIAKFEDGLRGAMGSEGVIPCEQRDEGEGKSFDAQPFEFNGQGFDAIDRTLTTCAVALAILYLGHNLTTEIKSGGSYAAAGVGEYIRDDIKRDDADGEWSNLGPQLARPYCLLNYGDPELAPIAIYETDAAAVSQARAAMINQLAQAIALLRANAPNVDVDALAEQFGLPLIVLDKARVQVPGPAPVEPTQQPQPPAREAA